MSTTTSPPQGPSQPAPFSVEDQLDQLIPPPLAWWKKLAIAGSLIAGTVLFAWAVSSGYLYPEPLNDGRLAQVKLNHIDYERDAVGFEVFVRNESKRDVRLTDVSFEGEGVEFVEAAYASWAGRASNSEATIPAALEGLTPREFSIAVAKPLPTVFPADIYDSGVVIIWVRPTDCAETGVPPWGHVTMTVDFGDGAFPRLSNTFRSDDPVWDGEAITLWDGEDFVEASSPLELACEVLR